MQSSNFQIDCLIGDLVRILGCSDPPFSNAECIALRRGVELLREIESAIPTARQQEWMRAHIGTRTTTDELGSQAMKFFGEDELNTKDKLSVLNMTLDMLPKLHHLVTPEEKDELFRFFLWPQLPTP